MPSVIVETGVDVHRLVARSRSRSFPFKEQGEAAASSTPVEVSKLSSNRGECLFLLERAWNIPYPDQLRDLTNEALAAKSHGYPSVRVWAEGPDGQVLGKAAEWPAKSCNTAPAWFTARSLGFVLKPGLSATLHVQVSDQKVVLGSLTLQLESLQLHTVMTRELQHAPGFERSPTSKDVSRISFQILDLDTVQSPKTIFLIRHGESAWNKAQREMQLHEMARTTDHPLTAQGRKQAEQLKKELQSAEAEGEVAVQEMLNPGAVFVSPLTRAVQTGLIALESVLTKPGGVREIVFMANAREKQNFGGLDTKSSKIGTEVVTGVLDELRTLYEGQEEGIVELFQQLLFDTEEIQDRWWCETSSENSAQLLVRLKEFMSQLLYLPVKSAIVVGHSYHIRAVLKAFMSPEFRKKQPQLARQLETQKVQNCGVVRIDLDPSRGLEGPITNAELVLGTELLEEGGGCLLNCCAAGTPAGTYRVTPIDGAEEEEIRPEPADKYPEENRGPAPGQSNEQDVNVVNPPVAASPN